VRIPDIAYRFNTPIDTSGPTAQTFIRALSNAAQLVSVQVAIGEIPVDKILVLTNAVILALPGATQSCLAARISGFTGAGMEFHIRDDRFLVDADENRSMNWQGEVYIHGRRVGATNLIFEGIFDAADNSNEIFIDVCGVVIPRGNMSLF